VRATPRIDNFERKTISAPSAKAMRARSSSVVELEPVNARPVAGT
jgi:hypothetical protein